MSIIRQMFKLLLKKDFWDNHKDRLPVKAFDDIGQELLISLNKAHSEFNRDLTEKDLFLTHIASNPTITTANKHTIEAYLENVKDEEDINADVAELVYSQLWRTEVGRIISQYGIDLADGELSGVDELSTFISKIGENFIPNDVSEAVDTDPVNLFNRLNQRGRWVLNIPTLDKRIKNVSPGQFIVLLARPESGKTATVINIIAGREGFAAQGARVHLLANEEGADITAGRAICCFNQVSFDTARANPSALNTDAWRKVKKNLTFVHQPEMSLAQLDAYCKRNKPDVLVIDQLDHINITGSFEKSTDRLGAIYRKARELASKYDMVVIGVSQASAEGEDKTKITFAMAENSKTSKAAAADLIVGIGKANDNALEESNEVVRYFTVSKNKISGWKGTVLAKLIQNESRLIA
jgi:replicative DNA helicase